MRRGAIIALLVGCLLGALQAALFIYGQEAPAIAIDVLLVFLTRRRL